MTGIQIKSTLVTVAVIFSCLVVAQQPAPNQPAAPSTLAPAPVPAPTPAPVPVPVNCTLIKEKPSVTAQNYHLHTCIVARLAGYIKVDNSSYIRLDNGVVNQDASVCPSEGNTTTVKPKLVIDFECGQLEFEITRNDTKVFVRSINGSYRVNTSTVTFSNTSDLFVTTQSDHYYKCDSEQTVTLQPTTPAAASEKLQLVLVEFAYETYRTTTGTDFYKIAEECPSDSGPFSDRVRIGVGICLVAFVGIALIAYFVGRRRWAQRSSYESV